jgi:hypothetical protein
VQRRVGEGDTGVLRLDTVDGVTEDPPTATRALAVTTFAAVAAQPAAGDARDQDSVARRHRADAAADRLDDADGLVTEDAAWRDLWHVPLEDVQIGATDGDRLDPHDGIEIVHRHRVGDLVPGHRPFTVIHECTHDGLLLTRREQRARAS